MEQRKKKKLPQPVHHYNAFPSPLNPSQVQENNVLEGNQAKEINLFVLKRAVTHSRGMWQQMTQVIKPHNLEYQ